MKIQGCLVAKRLKSWTQGRFSLTIVTGIFLPPQGTLCPTPKLWKKG